MKYKTKEPKQKIQVKQNFHVHDGSFHSPVSELCERITVCKWMYSCKHVISVSSQPCEKAKTINKQFKY